MKIIFVSIIKETPITILLIGVMPYFVYSPSMSFIIERLDCRQSTISRKSFQRFNISSVKGTSV